MPADHPPVTLVRTGRHSVTGDIRGTTISARRGALTAASTIVLAVLAVPVAAAEQIPVTVRIGDAAAPADPPPADGPAVPDPVTAGPPVPAPDAPPAAEGPPPAGEPPAGEAAPPPAAPAPGAPAPDAPAPSGPLPRTGSEFLALLRDGAAAIAAGLLVLLAARPSAHKERS